MTDPEQDGTIAVRDGEMVDVSALRSWLGATVPELLPAGAVVTIRQFPAGFSNLTYLLSIAAEDGGRALVLRRPPRGVTAGNAHDVLREYRILSALHPLALPVPFPIASCPDETVLGAPFYLMAHVDGVVLRGASPVELTSNPAAMMARLEVLSYTFVQTLVRLHEVDVSVGPLSTLGRPEGYVARQVQGWTKRWHASRTSEVLDLDHVAALLEAHRPPDRTVSLVHNDFKFDNLVLDPAYLLQVRAILDWEMATIGDPLMDLGTSLAYWVEAGDEPIFRSLGLGVTALPGCLTRAELVQAYGIATGRDVSDAPFYYAFGLFKVAVIAQQIHARSMQGLTADARFATLGDVVKALATTARRVTATNTL